MSRPDQGPDYSYSLSEDYGKVPIHQHKVLATLRLGIATVSSCRRFSVFWSLVASSCFTCSLRSSFLPAAARSGAGPPRFLQFHAGRRTELCSASKIIPPYATWLATYLHSYPTLCLANVLYVLLDSPGLAYSGITGSTEKKDQFFH